MSKPKGHLNRVTWSGESPVFHTTSQFFFVVIWREEVEQEKCVTLSFAVQSFASRVHSGWYFANYFAVLCHHLVAICEEKGQISRLWEKRQHLSHVLGWFLHAFSAHWGPAQQRKCHAAGDSGGSGHPPGVPDTEYQIGSIVSIVLFRKELAHQKYLPSVDFGNKENGGIFCIKDSFNQSDNEALTF